MRRIVEQFYRFLDYCSQQFFDDPRRKRRFRDDEEEFKPQVWRSYIERLKILLVIITGLAFVVSFVYSTYYYSNPLERVRNNPLTYDLLAAGLSSRTSFSVSPPCPEDEHLCWAKSDYDDQSWTEVQLTKVRLNELAGYKEALQSKNAQMYYRTKIKIPDFLYEKKEPLAYSPSYVNHEQYDAYVNGRLVLSGGVSFKDVAPSIITIAPEDINEVDHTVVIAYRTSLLPVDQGITSNAGEHVLSVKNVVNELNVADEQIAYTYFLLFIISKGSIFGIFALFYFFTSERKSLFFFLVYAFFSSVESLCAGDFLNSLIGLYPRILLMYAAKFIALCALLSFFVSYLMAIKMRKFSRYLNVAVILVATVLMSLFAISKNQWVNFRVVRDFYHYVLFAVLSLGILIAVSEIRLLIKLNLRTRYLKAIMWFASVMTIYLLLTIWEVYFNEHRGFDKRVIFDLLFFYFIASRTASDFGFQQKQVVSLEGHMREKQRMENELLEAAEIARAFLPPAAPHWGEFDIGVFHKSISESSGDWFAFESSSSGRFKHLVMCDITGHGVQAALIVSTCRTVLSYMVDSQDQMLESPDFLREFARFLNRILVGQGQGRHVATLLGLSFDTEKNVLSYLTAGHPSPLLVVPDPKGAAPQIKPLLSRHTSLGVRSDSNYEVQHITLPEEYALLAFTDGLPLASNLRLFKGFIASQDGLNAESIPQKLYSEVWEMEFQKSEKNPDDDVSIVWFSRKNSKAA